MLCAVVYLPHRYNNDFINHFSAFLADIVPKYDNVLIVGDFKVHVCCPENPMANYFLYLINSFNLVQSVSGPTQERGHTLDLVLSFGLPVRNLKICVTQCFLTICLYYLILLFPVIVTVRWGRRSEEMRILLNNTIFNNFKHRKTSNSRQRTKGEHRTYKDREIKGANENVR